MHSHQLVELWDQSDDWSGVTSSIERRRRQNRVNQRAARKRKHAQKFATLRSSNAANPNAACTEAPASDGPSHILRRHVSGSNSLEWMLELSTSTRYKAIAFKQSLYMECSLNLQAPSNIQILVRLNVLNALASNSVALSIPFGDLENGNCISMFNMNGPRPPGESQLRSFLPDNLRPTTLQMSVIHHPWIDVFPIPGIRDNILRGIDAALIDEDELCGALFAVDDSQGALAPIVVWGDPCDARSWELSPGFPE